MNVHAYRAAWAALSRGASGSELLVALALADHADKDGLSWPGRKRLAEMTGLSEATVKRAIARLSALAAVERLGGGQGRGKLSRYRLCAAAPENGAHVIPFPTRKGPAGDPFSEDGKGSRAPGKGVTERTQNPYLNHKARARALVEAETGAAKARELAASVARRGRAALVLPGWRGPEVSALAVTRYGADPEMLTALGCAVPPELRRRAARDDGREPRATAFHDEDDPAGRPAGSERRVCAAGGTP